MSEAATTEQPDETPEKQSRKKAGKKAKETPTSNAIALTGHPRAPGSIARLRSRAGLGAAAFVGLVSYRAGVPLDDAILRGLTAGVVGYFVGWYVGVTVWRQLIRAELRLAVERRRNAPADAE